MALPMTAGDLRETTKGMSTSTTAMIPPANAAAKLTVLIRNPATATGRSERQKPGVVIRAAIQGARRSPAARPLVAGAPSRRARQRSAWARAGTVRWTRNTPRVMTMSTGIQATALRSSLRTILVRDAGRTWAV